MRWEAFDSERRVEAQGEKLPFFPIKPDQTAPSHKKKDMVNNYSSLGLSLQKRHCGAGACLKKDNEAGEGSKE